MGNSTNNYSNEEKRLKESYYALLDRILKDRYDKNRKDIFNQSYSLFAKDFQKCYINQKIVATKLAHYFIPWKSYLMKAINNLANTNGYLWAYDLYNYISNESFQEQTKYQNMFFYEELQILSKPKIKNNNNLTLDKSDYDGKEKELKLEDIFNKEDKLEKNDPLYLIKIKISSNLMGSFISAESESPNSSLRRDPNYEYQYNKNKIKEYMEIFKEHLKIKEHPINLIIVKFIQEFEQYINNTIEFYKDNYKINKIGCQEKASDIIKQLQDFIVLMQNVIKLFYSRSISYEYFKDEKDEFLNLVSYIIFNSDIYHNFFELFELMNKEKSDKLEQQYELMGDIQPQEIGIKDKFCLNDKTNQFMEKLKLEKKNSKIYNKNFKNYNANSNILAINVNGEEKLLDIKDEEDISSSINDNKSNNNDKQESKRSDSKVSNSKISSSKISNSSHENNDNSLKVTSDSGKLNLFTKDFSLLTEEKDFSKMPYGQAIEFIKKLSDFKVPLEKLIIIASISSLITECVNRYWKSMERFIQPSMLSIDADELMTIFMYIIYKCHMPLLFVHADFIKYFTSPTTKSTMIGYYYTTLQGCLDFLLEVKDKGEFTKESI